MLWMTNRSALSPNSSESRTLAPPARRNVIMDIPKTNFNPPFRFGRASHLTFTVRDLARSRDFYTKVVGLVVSDDDRDTLFLRGVEERAHHSLVLKRTNSAPA